MRAYPLVLCLALVSAGCHSRTQAPAPAGAGDTLAAGEALTGPVLEHLAASPYMYLRVRTGSGEVWAAVPEGPMEDGVVVTIANPMLMSNFESTSLQRTFASVYFGTLATTAAGGALPPGHPGVGANAAEAEVPVSPVERAAGPDARTIAETWAQQASLVGKPVTIRGVVVKYNPGVMGKNWLHLRDGSGDAAQGTHDITVTTLEQVTKGATVTIRGTVRTNMDFGMGYSYPVLVEDARVVKP